MKIKESDQKFLARDLPAEDLELVKSEGNFLSDSKGKKIHRFSNGMVRWKYRLGQ